MKTIYFLLLLSTLLLTHLQTPSQQPQTTTESTDLVVATTLSEKVVELFREQKYKEALPLAKRALEIRERLLPANDPRIESSLLYLGDVQLALRDHGGANKRSLTIKESALGPKHLEVGHSSFMLGEQYRLRHDYDRAASFYTRAIAIYAELPDKPNMQLGIG